jgi:hypothetical protein
MEAAEANSIFYQRAIRKSGLVNDGKMIDRLIECGGGFNRIETRKARMVAAKLVEKELGRQNV